MVEPGDETIYCNTWDEPVASLAHCVQYQDEKDAEEDMSKANEEEPVEESAWLVTRGMIC